jgi:hypothetical protein
MGVVRIVPTKLKAATIRPERRELRGIVNIEFEGDTDLVLIADALGNFGAFFGSGQGGQEHRRKDGYDRDHYQQFDEGERVTLCVRALFS